VIRRTHQAVYDELGELVGYLSKATDDEYVVLFDAKGIEIGVARTVASARRQLLNTAFSDKYYFGRSRREG